MSGLYKYKGLIKSIGLVKATGLVIGKGLIKVINIFADYYQWVFKGSPSEIITKDSSWYYKNYGTAGSDVDIQIKNTQVAKFDGSCFLQAEIGSLASESIWDYVGDSVPSIDYANDRIVFTLGLMQWVQLTSGKTLYFQESNGDKIYTILTELLPVTILDVLKTAPQFETDNYYFIDESRKTNNVETVNNPVITFPNTSGRRMTNSIYAVGGQPIEFDFIFEPNAYASVYGTIVYTGARSGGSKGFMLTYNSTDIRLSTSDGATTSASTFTPLASVSFGNTYTCKFRWDGTAANKATLEIGGMLYTATNNQLEWTGNSASPFEFGSNLSGNANVCSMKLAYFELFGTFQYYIQERYGDKIHDTSGNANDATLVNQVEVDFFANTLDNVASFALTIGCTLYRNTSTNVYFAICTDTSQVVVDSERIGYFPNGSGILKGLVNEYVIPVDADLNAEIPAGRYDFDGIDVLVESDTLIKTKPNENQITNLIVKKKKLNSNLVSYNNSIIYNNITTYNA